MRQITILAVVPLLCLRVAVAADAVLSLQGVWYGFLEVPDGPRLRTVLDLYSRAGAPAADVHIIDQANLAVPVDGISVADGVLHLSMARADMAYDGQVDPAAQRLSGALSRGGVPYPLNLQRLDAVPRLPRPQACWPPFPYREEDVTYDNPAAGITLAGTLTLPPGAGPFPAVFLASGSGTQDRDETAFYHRPFRVLADHLTRLGIAVLRADDRGWGGSGGTDIDATTADNASDAQAAIDYLRTRPEIDARRLGIVGHSEGCLIGLLVADQDPGLAFLALLSAPGVPAVDLMRRQRYDSVRANGATEAQADALVRWFDDVHASVLAADDDRTARRQILERYPEYAQDLETLGWNAGVLGLMVEQVLSPWYRYFLTFDPTPLLERTRIPVLALNGSLDLQIASDPNLPALRAALARAGNPDATVAELEGLNHFFQPARTGQLTEILEISQTISPVALQHLGDWLRRQAGLDGTAVAGGRTTEAPAAPHLAPGYPNPFNGGTIISFVLPAAGRVRLDVHNALGQRVALLARGWQAAGTHRLTWSGRRQDGRQLASGTYVVRLVTEGTVQTRRLLLLR